MKKKELLNKLNDNTVTDEVCKNLIVRISDTLWAFPDDVEIDDSIVSLKNLGSLTPTRIDPQSGEQRSVEKIREELKMVLTELQTWVSQHSHTIESYVIDCMNKRTRLLLHVFLVFIGLLAVLALVFTVLNLIYDEAFINGWGIKIANALGTLDFALGAVGFILERKDDMKKKTIRNEAEKAKETGDPQELIKVCRANINTGINNGNIGGMFNRVKNVRK